MSHWSDDTIAAIATPPGEGSLCVVRISGSKSFQIADRVFQGSRPPSKCKSHTIHYGHIIDPDSNSIIDEVMLSLFRSPKTFTSEDVVEISGHGGYRSGVLILETLLRNGARLATPGEFTKRAFLNGRIDLVQAEAVAEIIRARTDASHRTALRQLDGRFSRTVKGIRNRLIDLLALVEVGLDFTEEGIDEIEYAHLTSLAVSIYNDLNNLKLNSERWRVLKDGVRVAIIGRPNVGKSSLLNQLVNRNRAIVDATPGTTRDTIEELIDVHGIPLNIVDTAGIRTSVDSIESQGIERSISEINNADLVIWILDGSEPLASDDIELALKLDSNRTVGVINKVDLKQQIDVNTLSFHPFDKWNFMSALDGTGIEDFKLSIFNVLIGGNHSIESDVLLNKRQSELLGESLSSLNITLNMFSDGHGQEIISIELRNATKKLGNLLGIEIGDDILDRVFSTFCIGK